MKIDDVKKLHQKKYRVQFGRYLVEGEHLILELQKALSSVASSRDIALYITEQNVPWAQDLSLAHTLHVVTDKQMSQISDTKTPQGMIACVPFALTHPSSKTIPNLPAEKSIYLHEIQDPGNLGTILRSLAWFGGYRLLLSPNSVDPFNNKVVRSSMGAIFHVPIELDVQLHDLQERFDHFAFLDLQGKEIGMPEFKDYQCYLFGNEARGVPHAALSSLNADAFTIKGAGVIDSLNLASAVNICSYQLNT